MRPRIGALDRGAVGRSGLFGGQVSGFGGCRLAPDQVPGAHHAFALDLDAAALPQHELVLQALVNVLGHLNLSHRVGGFHPGRDIDRVTPHVVEEAPRPHHARDHGAHGKADS